MIMCEWYGDFLVPFIFERCFLTEIFILSKQVNKSKKYFYTFVLLFS